MEATITATLTDLTINGDLSLTDLRPQRWRTVAADIQFHFVK